MNNQLAMRKVNIEGVDQLLWPIRDFNAFHWPLQDWIRDRESFLKYVKYFTRHNVCHSKDLFWKKWCH
jgi:hypothetical protein